MKNPIKSIFNLIEIFNNQGKVQPKIMLKDQDHCALNSIHDFYCYKNNVHSF